MRAFPAGSRPPTNAGEGASVPHSHSYLSAISAPGIFNFKRTAEERPRQTKGTGDTGHGAVRATFPGCTPPPASAPCRLVGTLVPQLKTSGPRSRLWSHSPATQGAPGRHQAEPAVSLAVPPQNHEGNDGARKPCPRLVLAARCELHSCQSSQIEGNDESVCVDRTGPLGSAATDGTHFGSEAVVTCVTQP